MKPISMSITVIAIVAVGVLASAQAPTPPAAKPPAGIDTAAIDRAIGKSGQVQGDVYRISFPRTDLSVSIGDVKLKAGFALGSWAAFKSIGVNGTAAHGDLVLTQDEINPVISALQEHKFEITALHNHLINETPHVMYMHFWGTGDAAALAGGLKDALMRTKTPLTAPPPATPPGTDDPPAAQIQQAIGLTGTVTNGVLGLSKPRPETIQMMGVTMPPAMGMATAINFQSAGGGRVATTGDFVMLGDEVNKVARALRQNGIEIAALHQPHDSRHARAVLHALLGGRRGGKDRQRSKGCSQRTEAIAQNLPGARYQCQVPVSGTGYWVSDRFGDRRLRPSR